MHHGGALSPGFNRPTPVFDPLSGILLSINNTWPSIELFNITSSEYVFQLAGDRSGIVDAAPSLDGPACEGIENRGVDGTDEV
jgi:hypothetical protein